MLKNQMSGPADVAVRTSSWSGDDNKLVEFFRIHMSLKPLVGFNVAIYLTNLDEEAQNLYKTYRFNHKTKLDSLFIDDLNTFLLCISL